MPVAQSVGWVKIVVKTSGSSVVVVVVTVDDDVPLATDVVVVVVVIVEDDDEAEAVGSVVVVDTCITLMVCSWPDARGTANKTNCQAEGNILFSYLKRAGRGNDAKFPGREGILEANIERSNKYLPRKHVEQE